MISPVTFEKTTYNERTDKFEAGTPNIADVIALGTAIDYWNNLDRLGAAAWEEELLEYATSKISAIPGVRIIGTAEKKAGVLSFVIEGVNAMDAGMYLDTKGVAVRTGQHCTEPVMLRFGVPGTIRASFMFYNTMEEIDSLVENLGKAIQLLQPQTAL